MWRGRTGAGRRKYDLHGADSARVYQTNQELWAHQLADVASAAGLPYTWTSPLGNWGNAAGLRSGDLHYWGVWHGDEPIAAMAENVGRFVSEYGFQSWPDSALLAKYIDPQELYLGSPALKYRQRSYKTDAPIWKAIQQELGEQPKTLGPLHPRTAKRCKPKHTRSQSKHKWPRNRIAWAHSSGS
jgi:hypothetical protein